MRSILSCLLALMLLLCAPPGGTCQELLNIHYTVADGLPSNVIYCVYRDSKGFLWIATDKGIARYNGIKFEKFTTYDGMSDNEIFLFREDYFGRLWLGTYNGELCYYENGIFHTAKDKPYLQMPVRKSYISHIYNEKDSSITVKFFLNRKYANIKNGTLHYFDLNRMSNKEDLPGIEDFRKLTDTTYELFHIQKIITIDTSYHILSIRPHNLKASLGWRMLGCQNQKYIYTDSFIADENKKPLKYFKRDIATNDFVYQLYFNGRWFVTTNNGIIIDDTTRVFRGLPVAGITQDNAGNYWIATLNNGLYQVNKDFNNVKQLKDVYKGKVVYAYADGAHVFFATSNHTLNSLSDGKTAIVFDYNKYLSYVNKYPTEDRYFIGNNYRTFSWSKNGYVEIENLLAKHLSVTRYPNNIPTHLVMKSIIGTDSMLYIDTRKELLRMSLASLHSRKMHFDEISDIAAEERIFAMAKDTSGRIWYSNVEDIFRIEKDGSKTAPYRRYNIALKDFNFFGDLLVGYTHNNVLYIGSYLDTKSGLTTVSSENCVWDKFYRLDATHVLISTSNLYRLLTIYPKGSATRYTISTVEDLYLPSAPESICTDANNCYFFKNGTITTIKLHYLFMKPNPPKLFFTFLKTGKHKYIIDSEFELRYRDARNISISFSTVSFGNLGISYQYSFTKDEPDNWRDVAGEEINLINPEDGEHLLKIRAKTITSGYSDPIILTLRVKKPFWGTWWFVALCTVLSVAILLVVIRLRVVYVLRNRERKHQNEIKFLRSEYKALNALMNPHFIFNTLNNVQSLINKDEKLAANKYLRIFANLVRQNMHNTTMDLIPLQNEIDIVTDYLKLEQLRFKELLNYNVSINTQTDLADIMVPPLLIQPLVENSIKHGIFPNKSSKSVVDIDISEDAGVVIITVKDNGIGLDAARKNKDRSHQSFGLENIRARIAQLSIIQDKHISLDISEIKDEAGQPLWTVVSVTFSLS